MMRRVFLFALTNIAVLMMISIVLGVLGMFGIHMDPETVSGTLLMAAIFGFFGSFVSLAMSKTVALRSVGGKVITTPQNETEAWLLSTVERLASTWKLKTPEVAVYQSSDPNAFATGARKNASLIAVSTGLLQVMSRDEVEGVLGHEMAHIGNGDMVTMTLIQGVVNTFVIFFSRIIASVVASSQGQNRESSGPNPLVFFLVNMVLQVVFGMLASIVVMWFSRRREYRADAGSAQSVGAPKMIAALKRLQQMQGRRGDELPQSLNAMGIRSGEERKDSLMSTHPSLENRIARLQGFRY